MVLEFKETPASRKWASKPALIAWSLYDWANSPFSTIITTFIISTYFTQAIAENPIRGTQQWGFAIALSGILIAVLSPLLGAIADQTGRRKPWLAVFTGMTAISVALLWFSKPSSDYIHWTLGCVIVGTICFEVAMVFYNAMMQGLVPDKYLGRLSGWAWGLGYAGGLICLSIAFFIMQFDIKWQGSGGNEALGLRFAGPLVALWLLIFSLPLFFIVPDHAKRKVNFKKAVYEGIRTFFHDVISLRSHKQILFFLVANMLYTDGLNTIFAFGGIYAAGEFGLTPKEIILWGILMNVSAGVGAALFGVIDDYLGSKRTILIALFCLIVLLSCLLLLHSSFWFWILGVLLALFVGPVQAASRSFLAHITPAAHVSKVFGLFAFSGKATAFLGPWFVGLATLLFSSQRIGMSVILVFLTMGLLLLLVVKAPKFKKERDANY